MTDDQWLSMLYEKNYALLYRIGRVILGGDPGRESTIEDQIQETFVRAWQKRVSLKNHPNPGGWLVECFRKCLANACRRQYREWKHRTASEAAEDRPDDTHSETLDPETYVRIREQRALLTGLLGEEDACLFLRYCVDGEKASALASELKVSEQAFRMRICRLKKKVLQNRELFACLVCLCLYSLR